MPSLSTVTKDVRRRLQAWALRKLLAKLSFQFTDHLHISFHLFVSCTLAHPAEPSSLFYSRPICPSLPTTGSDSNLQQERVSQHLMLPKAAGDRVLGSIRKHLWGEMISNSVRIYCPRHLRV